MQVMPEDARPTSFLSPLGYQNGSCGYCKKSDTSCSYYIRAKSLHVNHYQALVDRGWRRSGTLVYKPDPRVSCCPHYTIRLPVAEFKPRKDQKQAIHRWNKYVLGENYSKESIQLRPKSKAKKVSERNSEFDLFSVIHESEYDILPKPPEPEHRFEVTIEHDDYTDEKFALYQAYQKKVHNDTETLPSGFKSFLCYSPLNRSTRHINNIEQQLGSVHQCYRLDGRLIAMAVLDLLPHGVSGVYFIYHPDFERFSFGKISALREAALAHEGRYEYYYMGYYIHNCVKMRYKNDYRPQHFLDQETNTWDLLDDRAKSLMDIKKYVSMSKERSRTGSIPASEVNEDGHVDDRARESNEPKTSDTVTDIPSSKDALEVSEEYERGKSLFEIGLPGMMSLEELESIIDMDLLPIQVPSSRKKIVPAAMLVAWADSDMRDPLNLKGSIAEMLACLGPEVSKEVVVTFAH